MRDTRGWEGRLSRALEELKRRGSSVLVAGDVPETTMDRFSARFLGRTPSRTRAFALRDVGIDRVERRLRAAGPGREPAVVVDADTGGARSVAAPADGPRLPYLDVRTVEPSLDAVADGVETAVADVRRRHGPLDPADLRVCVDVCRGGPEPSDDDATAAFLATVREAVVGAGGMAHVVVPAGRDAAVVERLRPAFDVVVALRKTNAAVEQRWTVPEYGVETGWTEVATP